MNKVKKIFCFIITFTLLLSTVSMVYAKPVNSHAQNKQKVQQEEKAKKELAKQEVKKQEVKKQEVKKQEIIKQEMKKQEIKKQDEKQEIQDPKTTKPETSKGNGKLKEKKQSFKIEGSSVIKYGRYILPIRPVTKGMGATVNFDKTKAILTVTKGTNVIVIDFIKKTVAVNGVYDTSSNIFTANNEKKRIVLIKYIAAKLGIRMDVDDDEVVVIVPGLDLPTGVTVTPMGAQVKTNTLNSTTLFMEAKADMKAGQAVGGKAELYVGSKLVAVDSNITAADTTVNFSTSDGTPTNAELQIAVPVGGVVTVKLYNADGSSVISAVANPTLVVDYTAPVVTAVSSAVLSVSGSAITIYGTSVNAVNDKVDVTKISLYDTALNKTYQLTNMDITGSVGVVSSDNTITIHLGSVDLLGLMYFGSSAVVMNIAPGALLYDDAGNTSPVFNTNQAVPVTVIQ